MDNEVFFEQAKEMEEEQNVPYDIQHPNNY
jgi:hypothetical protein